MHQMKQHSFRLELPTSTPFAEVETIALEGIVFPHMIREGKSSYADLRMLSRTTHTAGTSIFVGQYLL